MRAWARVSVLLPHFQPTLVPGWLDKPLKRRHRASARLDNVVPLVPQPQWVGHVARRQAARPWRLQGLSATTPMRACAHGASRSHESQRMADEFERLVSASSVDAEPLP